MWSFKNWLFSNEYNQMKWNKNIYCLLNVKNIERCLASSNQQLFTVVPQLLLLLFLNARYACYFNFSPNSLHTSLLQTIPASLTPTGRNEVCLGSQKGRFHIFYMNTTLWKLTCSRVRAPYDKFEEGV